MNFRRARPGIPTRPTLAILARAAAVACIAAIPLAVPAADSAAQPPPSSVGIDDAVAATSGASIGAAVIDQESGTAWIAGDGVVVTSSTVATEVGTSGFVMLAGSTEEHKCYVARIVDKLRIAVLRCDGLGGTALDVATAYPAPGTPVFALAARYDKSANDKRGGVTLRTEGGTITANDFEFMGTTRPQFSIAAGGERLPATGILDDSDAVGVPIIGADGKVLSTVLTTPIDGGLPIGTTPSELSKQLHDAENLPATFNAAAVLTASRRAIIPVAVGFVLGLIWAAIKRNGSLLVSTLGLATLGLLGSIAYTAFTLLVVGPQTLIG